MDESQTLTVDSAMAEFRKSAKDATGAARPLKTLPADFDFGAGLKTLPADFDFSVSGAAPKTLPADFDFADTAKAVGRQAWDTITKPAAAGIQEALGMPNPERATVTGAYDLASGAVRQMFDDGRMFGPGVTGDVVRNVASFSDRLGRGAAGLADFAMSPLGAALPVAGKALPAAVNAGIGAGFAADMAEPTAQHLKKAWEQPNAETLGDATASVIGMLLPAAHAGATEAGNRARARGLEATREPIQGPETAREFVERAPAEDLLQSVLAEAKPEISKRQQRGEIPMEATAGPRMNRDDRRDTILPSKKDITPEEYVPLIDPKLREIATTLDLGEYEQLTPEEKAIVRQLRDEQGAVETGARGGPLARDSQPLPVQPIVAAPQETRASRGRRSASVVESGAAPVDPQPQPTAPYSLTPEEQRQLRESGRPAVAEVPEPPPTTEPGPLRPTGPAQGQTNYSEISKSSTPAVKESLTTQPQPAAKGGDLREGQSETGTQAGQGQRQEGLLGRLLQMGREAEQRQQETPPPPPTIPATPAKVGDVKIAAKLRKLADSLAIQADEKRNSGVFNQNPTARRARIGDNITAEANRLERIHKQARRLADMQESGDIPAVLRNVDSRAALEDLQPRFDDRGNRQKQYERFPHPFVNQGIAKQLWEATEKHRHGIAEARRRLTQSRNSYLTSESDFQQIEAVITKAEKLGYDGAKYLKADIARARRLYKAGITPETYAEAVDAVAELTEPRQETAADRVRKLEQKLLGTKIEGFFPTPKPIISRMVQEADIKPGMRVLEPSAGKGDIAEAIRDAGASVVSVEKNQTLRDILQAKNLELSPDSDFLEHKGQYDRIVMNPPFERGQDAAHVRHAYDLLNPGGRIVAIMGEGSFFRNDRAATEFREWLNSVGGESEKLPEGSFTGKDAFRQTGTATRLVVIDKPVAQASYLDRREAELSASVKQKWKDAGSTLSAGPGLAAELLADYAQLGAIKIAKGAVKFSEWSREMIREYGPQIEKHLGRIWMKAKRIHEEQLKAGDSGSGEKPPVADRAAMPTPEPEGQGAKPEAPKATRAADKRLLASPSLLDTQDKFVEKVGVSEPGRAVLKAATQDWADTNELRKVGFEEIKRDAKEYDPKLLLDLDQEQAKKVAQLEPGMYLALKNGLRSIMADIGEKRAALDNDATAPTDPVKRMQAEQDIARLESDAQKLTDIILPVRSQAGRRLAYERIAAERTFDAGYWFARAKRAAALPEGVDLPEAKKKALQGILAEGTAAEAKARKNAKVAMEAGPTPAERAKAEREAKAELEAETREQVVEQKFKRLVESLKAAILDPKQTVDPVTAEERAGWESNPEIIKLRAELAEARQRRKPATPTETREQVVEQKRKEFLQRLRRQAQGDMVTASPVTPAEKQLWEADPEVLKLRAKIAANRPAAPLPPTSAEKQARYKERLLAKIDEKLAGVVKERKASKWALSEAEQRAVDMDPAVRQARTKLARFMAEQHKQGWWDLVNGLRRAGMLTATGTHIRNNASNFAYQMFNDASRPAAMLADFAMNKLTPVGAKQRTVQMTSWDAMREASKEAATKGIAEAAEIMKTGQVPDEGSALIDYSRDFTAGRDKLGENKLGRGVDRAVNFVFRTMKAEDRLTKRYAFTRSLKEQMALAKVKTPTPDMVTQAWLDADFMTFNQKNMAANEFSKLLGSLKRQGVVGETAAGVLDMLVPFKNTPANVFMRGFEASGFGVVSGGFKLARAIAAGERLTPVEQRNIAMTIGRGATGMAAVMAGYYLAKNGFMTGVTDKDEQGERNVRTLGGRQDGALKVGDKWISIAGLSPVANAFIVGATWYDSGKGAIWKILTSPETFGATSAAAFRDLPMVRGVSDAMEALQNPKRFAGQAAANMAGSFVPSIVNEAGQMTDTARRETRADSLPGQVARAVANRVPGLRQQLPERLDVFGRPIPQDQVGVAFGFPLSTETKDPVVKEMMRVDAKVGTAARGKAEKDEAYRKRLDRAGATTEQMERKPAETDAQYSERVKLQGKAMRNRLALLMVGNRYKQADDEMKADLIEETIKKARTRANKQARAGRR